MPSSNDDPESRQHRRAIGRTFEKMAAAFYEENGYTIHDRNWQAGRKEIDLIVAKKNLVVFVEVKSSSTKKYGHPAERVDKKKIANLTDAARQYLIEKEIDGVDLRFDLVTFVDGQLEHFPGAFEAND